MNKLRMIFAKVSNNNIAFSVLSNVITIIVGVVLFHPFFEEGDDLQIAMIAEGSQGAKEFRLINSNAILGKLYIALGNWFPRIRWHMVLQYLFLLIAMIAFVFIVSNYKRGKIISIIFEIACLYEIYVSMQYTKTAVVIGLVSFLIMFHLVKLKSDLDFAKAFSKKSQRILFFVSCVLCIYSVMLRNESYFIALLPFIVVIIIDIIVNHKCYSLNYYLLTLALVLSTFFIYGGLEFVDGLFYESNDWQYFRYYFDERTTLLDYHQDALNYANYSEELEALGVSENDAFLYSTWSFADEKVVTPELMNDISKITENRKIVSIDLIKAYIAGLYNDVFLFEPLIFALIMLIIVICFKATLTSPAGLMIFCQIGLICLCTYYYEYCERWNHRLLYSSLLSLMIVIVYSLAVYGETFYRGLFNNKIKKKFESEVIFRVTVCAIGVMVFPKLIGNELDYNEYMRNSNNFAVFRMYMQEEKDTLFVLDTFSTMNFDKYNVFLSMEQGIMDNCIQCGQWTTGSPIVRNVVEKYGFFDPFDALKRGKGEVVLVDNYSPDSKALHLTEHADGPRYVAEYVKNIAGYNLYRIR